MPKIVLFRDFAEDRRDSMEVYADHLAAALTNEARSDWRIDYYRPLIPRAMTSLPLNNRHRLRLARFLSYPWQARRARGDLNHIIDQGYGHLALVLGSRPIIVTVHDLIPLLSSKGAISGFAPSGRHPLSTFSFRMLKRASHLIADSENTKRDLIQHIGCDAGGITVVHLGIGRSFKPCGSEEKAGLRAKLGLPDHRSYLVLVIGHSFYKNQETSLAVVRDIRNLCSRQVMMVRLGPCTPDWLKMVTRAGMKDRVVNLTSVSVMHELYNAVDCLLFPSWYEGFGLPPLEAMACGVPAVTSNSASLPEIVGDAALTAAPDDVQSLGEAVRLMLENSARRGEQIAKGHSHVRNFTWENTARKTAKVYEMLLDKELPAAAMDSLC